MNNRVYYGEYSLKHWIDLILKQNIILPEYQRHFVWSEKKVTTLIETFKNKQFIPPITIGIFKNEIQSQNLILDGQQRLTSILLAYLGLFPDEATYKNTLERLMDENDEPEEDELDNIHEWTFNKLIEKGRNKENIITSITPGNYKIVNFGIDENFLKNNFLGFSYLVPYVTNEQVQQKYYSSVFRNINIQGQTLLPQESRASLYFLDKSLVSFFNPDFFKSLVIKNVSITTKADFVRFISLLSQYKKDGNTSKIAKGFKSQMEKYYEEYIYSVVGENTSIVFPDFATIFPGREFNTRLERLKQTIISLDTPQEYTSIIDMDIHLFGMIYIIVFENKSIKISDKEDIKTKLSDKIANLKTTAAHTDAPGALKYLKLRIETSINIYKEYENE